MVSQVNFAVSVDWGSKPGLVFEQMNNNVFYNNDDQAYKTNEDLEQVIYVTTSSEEMDEMEFDIQKELEEILIENEKVHEETTEYEILFPTYLRKCEAASVTMNPSTERSLEQIQEIRSKFSIRIEYQAKEHPENYENTAFTLQSTKSLPMLPDLSNNNYYR